MNNSSLTDIDTLCLNVRERESKCLISEAIAAYRGGTLRSAIMSTWIAVAFDTNCRLWRTNRLLRLSRIAATACRRQKLIGLTE